MAVPPLGGPNVRHVCRGCTTVPRWVYDRPMRLIPVLTLLLSSLAFGGETLPDEARLDDGEGETNMQERFSAPVMGADELESLYLQSPVEIGGSPAQGMRSVQGEELYSDSDAQIMERQRVESRSADPIVPPVERPPLPTIPVGVPIRQL